MRSEKGAALVEAAIVLPFLLLLVLGVVDLTRAYYEAAKVQEAAQEGAVFAASNPSDPLDIIARAEDTVDSPDLTGSATVTCPSTDQVTVTVSYTYEMITPLIRNAFGSSLDLTHGETAKILGSDPCVPSP